MKHSHADMRRMRWLLFTMVVSSTAQALCPLEQGACLPTGGACPPCPCPADEHGPVCALVVDEVKQLEGELAQLVDIELSSPDGAAVVGMMPAPKRVEVPGRLTLRRQRVTHACALVNGRPAQVRLLPDQNGKQVIELRSRRRFRFG